MSIEPAANRNQQPRGVRGWGALAVVALLAIAACGPSNRKQLDEQQAINRFQLGSRFMGQGELRRAVAQLQQAVDLDPGNDRYHNGLGQAYLFLGELTLAEGELRRAIKINPASTEAHHNLALVYSEMGDYDHAEEEYEIAVSNPTYLTPEKIYLNWGATLEKKGDAEGALAKMRKAVALNPRYGRGHYQLGEFLEGRGDANGALEEYLKAYQSLADAPELNLKLGEIYLQQGNPARARHYLERVVELAAPESTEALRAQAYLEELSAG